MRKSGILLPVFSLPSPHGIGTCGKAAFRFVDFLKAAGQRYWQILPLHPTGFGDSPYQCFSAFAGNPYFIDLDILCDEGLLLPEEIKAAALGPDTGCVDYGRQYARRFPLLRRAFSRFTPGAAFAAFCAKEEKWLLPYARFMALKTANDGAPWNAWKEKTAAPDEVRFWQFLQYHFFAQWQAVKDYANAAGIEIIGDMPMYVAYDSADVWETPEQFLLDERGLPLLVAGCPPDAFSADGQLWGNPIYDWAYMARQTPAFSWWGERMAHALRLYDVVRIDHFRGFASYYTVPFGEKTARRGKWCKGPGMPLFDSLRKRCGELPIMAEDLGFLTPEVRALLKETGFPGMKVLQFAFDSREESDYLPHNYDRHCVVYTGTHDNDTVLGWARTAAPADVAFAGRYLHMGDGDSLNWSMMRAAVASVADTAILTMQDILGLSSEGRINTPATDSGNWTWRLDARCLNDWLSGILREMTALYGRCGEGA